MIHCARGQAENLIKMHKSQLDTRKNPSSEFFTDSRGGFDPGLFAIRFRNVHADGRGREGALRLLRVSSSCQLLSIMP